MRVKMQTNVSNWFTSKNSFKLLSIIQLYLILKNLAELIRVLSSKLYIVNTLNIFLKFKKVNEFTFNEWKMLTVILFV